jgi:site-specific DNA-methyltransferase (cytosine-N4-specific)
MSYQLYCDDCVNTLKAWMAPINAVFCDPPYPETDRDYGRMSIENWMDMMQTVVLECKRLLTSDGSMAIVLQPNSAKVGQMRTWLWEFLIWASKEWNVVQDCYWHNTAAMPSVHCTRKYGLMRPSIKMIVWLGPPDCYRNQDEVLIPASKPPKNPSDDLIYSPSGHHIRHDRAYSVPQERGGATPFNLISMPNTNHPTHSATYGHGAGTPYKLTQWWVRYISRPGDMVLDPFSGVATTGVVALEEGRDYIGIESSPKYHTIAEERLKATQPRSRG